MDSRCCFSAFSFNTARNVAKWTCFGLKRAFLGLKYFSPFCSSHTTLFFQSPPFPSAPHNPSCVIFGFESFWFHSVSGLSFSWAAGVAGSEGSACPGLLVCLLSDRHMKCCLELHRAFAAFAVLFSLFWLCSVLALLDSKPQIHQLPSCSRVSKWAWNWSSQNGLMSVLWKGEIHHACSLDLGHLCETATRTTAVSSKCSTAPTSSHSLCGSPVGSWQFWCLSPHV